MFSGLFSGHFSDAVGAGGANQRAIFIDRDPTLFRHVLNYLRDGGLCLQGMTQLAKAALLKEARFYGIAGLVSLLQLDARSLKNAQRRELSSEKEYKVSEDVPVAQMAQTIRSFTMEEGFEFEGWIAAQTATTKTSKQQSAAMIASARAAAAAAATATGAPLPLTNTKPPASVTQTTHVHLIFSKKLSRGELMLLDRLQNHM
jgi:hypothetical protein